jgi:CheY-like chemotaxis protein
MAPDYLRDLRVLVVDDEQDARDLLSELLTNYGAEVKTCASAAEALRTLDKWRPDALVSDLGMPGEDGYDLLRKIRAREPERGGRIPAIALTAYARAEDARRALVTGYQMRLPKRSSQIYWRRRSRVSPEESVKTECGRVCPAAATPQFPWEFTRAEVARIIVMRLVTLA